MGIVDWLDHIIRGIAKFQCKLRGKDYMKLKLDLLLRAADRIAGFSADCVECKCLQEEITKLVEGMSDSAEQPKEQRKSHLKGISTIVKHLQKRHNLICEGNYTAYGISMGMAFGVVIGAGMQNVAIGIFIGTSVGAAMGIAMDADAKKKGKVI